MIPIWRGRNLALEAAEVRRIMRISYRALIQAALNTIVCLIFPAL